MRFMTWNMQGAGGDGDSVAKWDALAAHLIDPATDLDAVALQECGTISDGVPGNAVRIDTIAGDGWDIEVYRWTVTDAAGADHEFFISHVWFDYGGRGRRTGRVNLAIVTKIQPEEGETTMNERERRPGVGIRLPGEAHWIFSVHCNAAFGCDAEDLIANVRTAVGRGGRPWVILGDFNKEPGDLLWDGETLREVRNHGELARLDAGPTHNRRAPVHTLDYAVMTETLPLTAAAIHDFGLSDHCAVVFED
jgi:hypothetical protein